MYGGEGGERGPDTGVEAVRAFAELSQSLHAAVWPVTSQPHGCSASRPLGFHDRAADKPQAGAPGRTTPCSVWWVVFAPDMHCSCFPICQCVQWVL